jgi:hypothetical protein
VERPAPLEQVDDRHRQHREQDDLRAEQELQAVVGDLAVGRDLQLDQPRRGGRADEGHRDEPRDPRPPARQRDAHPDDAEARGHQEPDVDVHAPPVDGERARRLHLGEHDGGLRQAEQHRDDDSRRHRDLSAGRRPPAPPQRQEQREERGPGQREQQHPGARDADDRSADRGERER